MAQTGYTPILIYSSSTTTNAPSASNLTNSSLGSELAINITDGKLFYKDNGGSVQVIAWKTTPTSAGGTGLTSYAAGDLLYYASGTALSKLSIGSANQILKSTGSAPAWANVSDLAVTSITFGTTGLTPSTATQGAVTVAGTLVAANGGTGQSSYAVGDILYASGTTTLSKLADVATGNALISGGVGVAPSWGKIGLTTHVSGVLPVANGGTNASSASITAFNNITGYTATGATGTTSTNLVFSTSPTITSLTYTNASNAAPTFSAYLGTNQTVSTGQTKVQLNTKVWDTNTNYDNSTNYRFTPTVAGYYQVNFYANCTSSVSLIQCSIYLNGSNIAAGSEPTTGNASQVAALIYMNGSTDYIEFYMYAGVGGGTIVAGRANTCANAAWVRSA